MNTPAKVGRSRVAKAHKLTTKTRVTQAESWVADCYGRFWGGYTGWYEYKFTQRPTRDQVLSVAGDFESVDKIRLTHLITVSQWTEEIL